MSENNRTSEWLTSEPTARPIFSDWVPGEMLKMAPSFGLTLLLVTGAASAAPGTYLRAQVFYQTGQDCNPLASAASYSVMVSINFAPVSCFPSLAFLCLAFLVPLSGSWPLILLPS